MSGPSPETTQDRTHDTHPILKSLTLPGIELGLPGWKAGTLLTPPQQHVFSLPVLLISYSFLHNRDDIRLVSNSLVSFVLKLLYIIKIHVEN